MATIDMMFWKHRVTVISPGSGSAVGEKGKKWGQKEKISAKEASQFFPRFFPTG